MHIAGQPLLRKGGYPLRLLVPRCMAKKSSTG
ncbi:MAG: molybdopterin-dependent oxidoreductase [Acidithiobacillus sp.]|nr:molybdopterin-dependent oxidoreductase [Acidithiobacillus sp.]